MSLRGRVSLLGLASSLHQAFTLHDKNILDQLQQPLPCLDDLCTPGGYLCGTHSRKLHERMLKCRVESLGAHLLLEPKHFVLKEALFEKPALLKLIVGLLPRF